MADKNKRISKEEFFRLLDDPDAQEAPGYSKANWDAIYDALRETNIPLDIRTIYEQYVKGVVTRYRTKNKLQEWAAQDKCLMIFKWGRYWFYFGDEAFEASDSIEEPEDEDLEINDEE